MRSAACLALLLVAAQPAAAHQANILGRFHKFIAEHLEHARDALRSGDCPLASGGHEDTCHSCTERVAKHVTELAMAKMAATCQAGGGCPHACRQLQESPKVMLGVLLQRLRPVELAEMYCAGRGRCTKQQMLGKVGFHATAMRITMEADKEDVDEVLQGYEELEGKVAPDAPHQRMGHLMGQLPRADPDCMHKVIEKVMATVVQPGCNSTATSGLVGAACEFGKENPEVFRGMMLAKVEPWKYASGYCAPHEPMEEHQFHPLLAAFKWIKHSMASVHHQHCDMKAAHECHERCGHDRACHEACPKPWQQLAERCEAHAKAKECHMACRHDFACHFQCPLGPMQNLSMEKVAKIASHVACHAGCRDDRACHQACSTPWRHFDEKCALVAEIHTCHQGCSFDRGCHERCPRLARWEESQPEGEEPKSLPIVTV